MIFDRATHRWMCQLRVPYSTHLHRIMPMSVLHKQVNILVLEFYLPNTQKHFKIYMYIYSGKLLLVLLCPKFESFHRWL